MWHECIYPVNEKVSGHETTSLGKWSGVLGSVCRRELADAPPGLALTLGQTVAKTAGFELWGTLLGPVSRNNFAV